MVQHMSNLLTSAHGILAYGMILTTLFRACHIDLSTKTDVRMPKPSNAIDNACITRLGYEYIEGQWLEKGACVPAALEDDIDKEAIPPPSPHVVTSPPPLGTRSSFECPKWYTDLLPQIDSLSLDREPSPRITFIALIPLRLSKLPCSSFCDLSFHLHNLSI